jgi:8-oxo-dGTP pyrophosphatase MutT (NUDIX family)
MPIKPWKLVSSKMDSSYPIFNLRTDRAISPRTQKAHDFYILESLDWVNVIPITIENDVVLIRQYRHGIRDITLEIPGGIIEKKDTPERAALRELKEETGYSTPDIIELSSVYPNPAFLDNRCYTFLAKDVSPAGGQDQDEKEDIEILLKPLEEIPRLIKRGEISHSLILAAFYRFFMEYKLGEISDLWQEV